MFKFCYLSSGSAGNALAIWAGDPPSGVLVDVGLSATQIAKRMRKRDIDPAWIKAIFLGQAHKDHTAGIEVWSNRHETPLYATAETANMLGRFCRLIEPRQTIKLSHDFRVTSVPVWHDNQAGGAISEETGAVTFMVEHGDKKLALLYETGRITFELASAAEGAGALLIEANHCAQMLAAIYHPSLAERVAATHLSTQQAAQYLRTLDDRTKIVVAIHRSLKTNDPELVRSALQEALDAAGLRAQLVLAEQDQPTPVFQIGATP